MATSSDNEAVSYRVCINAAVSAHRQGCLDEAGEVCRRRLRVDQPGDPHLQHLLALIALQRGNGDSAVAEVTQSIARVCSRLLHPQDER